MSDATQLGDSAIALYAAVSLLWLPIVLITAALERRARRNRPLPPPEDPRQRNDEALRQYRERAEHVAQAETRDAQWHS